MKPRLQKLYNESYNILIQIIQNNNIDFQLIPPNNNRRNADERASLTLKNHFIAILCSVNPNFSLQILDRLLDQLTTTLNLMQRSRINPDLSAQ